MTRQHTRPVTSPSRKLHSVPCASLKATLWMGFQHCVTQLPHRQEAGQQGPDSPSSTTKEIRMLVHLLWVLDCCCCFTKYFQHLHLCILADGFIQSNLQCIQVIHLLSVLCVPWELNPQPFALLTQCSTTEPQEHDDLHDFCNVNTTFQIWGVFFFYKLIIIIMIILFSKDVLY